MLAKVGVVVHSITSMNSLIKGRVHIAWDSVNIGLRVWTRSEAIKVCLGDGGPIPSNGVTSRMSVKNVLV